MLIVITGPASSGKDTIMQRLLTKYPLMKRIITTTTRGKRPGELEDRDYHFVSREIFKQMIKDGKMLEYVQFFGNMYGTTKDALDPLFQGRDLIWRVETSRAAEVEEVLLPDLWKDTVVLYIDVPNWRLLRERMRKRGVSEKKINERLAQDKADFEKYSARFNNIIFNEEGRLEQTMEKVTNLIKSHRNRNLLDTSDV